MNKKLFEKVKELCKDCGLSEKYLQSITEKMGGEIKDDSTDEDIVTQANLIAGIAKDTQGEATRWVASKKKKKGGSDDDQNDDDDDDDPKKQKPTGKTETDFERRLSALEKENSDLKKVVEEQSQRELASTREAEINKIQKELGIPDWRMEGLVVPEDKDPKEYLSVVKQKMVDAGLEMSSSITDSGSKAELSKATDEMADELLKDNTVE